LVHDSKDPPLGAIFYFFLKIHPTFLAVSFALVQLVQLEQLEQPKKMKKMKN